MKWLFLAIGAVVSVAFRELGAWGPKWADNLLIRRSRRLPKDERTTFVRRGRSRYNDVPGDWGKLLYTATTLTRKKYHSRRGAELLPLSDPIATIFALVPAAVAGLSIRLALSVALNVRWYAAVIISVMWAFVVLSVDQLVWFGAVTFAPRASWAAISWRLLIRLAFSGLAAIVIAEPLVFYLFSDGINHQLASLSGPGLTGVLGQEAALEKLSSVDSAVLLTRWTLVLGMIIMDFIPTLRAAFVLRRGGRRGWGRPKPRSARVST